MPPGRLGCSQQPATPWLELSDTFCRYVGGIAGTDSGLFGYFVLALFWAPSSCTANNSVLGGFCSNFTGAGSYAAHNLVLHGERLAPLWGGKHLELHLHCLPVMCRLGTLLDACCTSEPATKRCSHPLPSRWQFCDLSVSCCIASRTLRLTRYSVLLTKLRVPAACRQGCLSLVLQVCGPTLLPPIRERSTLPPPNTLAPTRQVSTLGLALDPESKDLPMHLLYRPNDTQGGCPHPSPGLPWVVPHAQRVCSFLQGFSMWCNGPNVTALPCQVNGNLCPLKNASNAANYTQDMYETCLRQYNVGFWVGSC